MSNHVPYPSILEQAPGNPSKWSDLPGIKSGNPFDGSGVYTTDLPDGHTWNPQVGFDPRWLSGGGAPRPTPVDSGMTPEEEFAYVNNIEGGAEAVEAAEDVEGIDPSASTTSTSTSPVSTRLLVGGGALLALAVGLLGGE
ncbi:hypothetical protein [Salinigranum sp. GCM10025319]|uniref:hypothetical protein n=1 Tax=Salinigranum sp. GCM10025319 TaxID=3252687 RepID=UPI00361EDB06